MPLDPVRDAAIDVLLRVFVNDAYLNLSLDKTIRRKGDLSDRGRRFLAQLAYGTVRHRLLCDSVLSKLVTQPLDQLPAPIFAILRMGVFQALFCNQVTFPSMVNTSVDLAKKRGHPGTTRLVNAVLRRVPESLDLVSLPDREADLRNYLRVRYSMPRWIVDMWLEAYGPEQAEAICAASNVEAPATARVNRHKTTRDELIEKFTKQKIAVVAHPGVPDAVVFPDGHLPLRSKLFQEGHFYAQDPASMAAPCLLEPEAGQRVLDLCAAPGGKTTHLAEIAGDRGMVVAGDRHGHRLFRVMDNAERLGLRSIRPVVLLGEQAPFTGGFDRVLVDAPCSGLGTLRRHPDLKWRMKRTDLAQLRQEQGALLRAAIELCENGGLVVYSVCTFTAEETEGVLEDIRAGGNVTVEDGPEWLNRWKQSQGTYRILPGENHLDGYFLMRLRKRS